MDDVQKQNNCVNIPLSQTFRSWKYTFIYVVAVFKTLKRQRKVPGANKHFVYNNTKEEKC
jgi:hypothetical protein